jgi:hypothetical protein
MKATYRPTIEGTVVLNDYDPVWTQDSLISLILGVQNPVKNILLPAAQLFYSILTLRV